VSGGGRYREHRHSLPLTSGFTGRAGFMVNRTPHWFDLALISVVFNSAQGGIPATTTPG